MHTNHRRYNPPYTTKRHGFRGWLRIYSMKPMKRQKSRDRRAEERRYIETEQYDRLTTRSPRNIIWEYW